MLTPHVVEWTRAQVCVNLLHQFHRSSVTAGLSLTWHKSGKLDQLTELVSDSGYGSSSSNT